MNTGWQEEEKSQGKGETEMAVATATVTVQKEWLGIQADKQAVPDGRRRNWVRVLTVRVQGHKARGMLKGKEAKSRKNPKQKRV